jgi:site-specific recombinase XerD
VGRPPTSDDARGSSSPSTFSSLLVGLVVESTLLRRLRRYCDDLGFPEGLDPHSLRRSYAAHLLEDGWDPMFVQHQMGHEHASTTGIYQFASTAHVCKAHATAAIRGASPTQNTTGLDTQRCQYS